MHSHCYRLGVYFLAISHNAALAATLYIFTFLLL